MRILLTNDDGIHAPGMAVLERLATPLATELWVVAPAEEQSGAGHSLTLHAPLRIRKHGERRYSVTGTPTDAVMLALGKLMKDQWPDLILSGVNRGANLGEDITYSGTVSAAMEGALAGVPSIALSQVMNRDDLSLGFACAEAHGPALLEKLITALPDYRTLTNVNFPACAPEAVRGASVCEQGFRDFSRLDVIERTDPRGGRYYWFGLGPSIETPGHRTDLERVADNYIAVTPLHLDLTHHDSLEKIARVMDGSTPAP